MNLSRRFANLPVRHKLNLLTVLIAIGIVALAVIAARMQYLDLYETRKASLARAQANLLVHQAISELDVLPESKAKNELIALARMIIDRDH